MIELLLLLGFVQLSSQSEKNELIPQGSQNRLIKAAVTKINDSFSGRIDQLVPEAGSNNEISGCTFTNIVNSGINNFIKVQGPTLFKNNVIQNDDYLNDQPGVIWLNANVNFVLVNCSFIKHRTRSTDDAIILTVNEYNMPNITFESCKFIDCSNDAARSLVKLNHKQSTVNFTDCLFTFSDSTKACQVLYIKNPNTVFDRCNFIGCGPNAINIDIEESTTRGQFKFTKNDVKTVRNNFLTMQESSATIEMNDNIFTDVSLTDEYFIHIHHSLSSIQVSRNTFSKFTMIGTSEKNCGGIATFFQNPSSETSSVFTLVYDHCTFVDIQNERTNGPSSYGGAIQFGFGNYLSSLHVTISNCFFNGSKAYKHGGALAIQTSGNVIIKNCTFENNVANNKQSTSLNLLNEKEEGRGGAIYLNPLFTSNSINKQMASATIEDCKFSKNVAFGGYAIYIDGNSDTTAFTITGNKFFNNYGENSEEQSKHGAIDSETLSIGIEKIENENDFSVIENGSGSKLLVHVDSLGNALPDPTSTPKATQPPTPTPIADTSFDFIDKYYEGNNYTDQIELGRTNIKQISGCTFKNILKPSAKPNMNNFIQVLGESTFFNNVVENDEIKTDQPAVFWLNTDITFTISHCKFIRVTHRVNSNDANILTVDGDNNAIVNFESCEFIECAYSSDESLVKLKNKDPTITFNDCVISFGQTGCQIIQAMNPQVVFERCQISGSVSNAINLSAIPNDSTLNGIFTFNNNIVKKQTNNFINIRNLKSVPQINNNVFEDVTLINNEYMIYIENNQKKLKLAFNTFSRITTSADSETYSGGFSCFMPSSAQSSATNTLSITYENCNFYDISNMISNKPYYQGGAVQCGFNKDFCNLDMYVINCMFKGNQAFKHGGAIAVQIQGSLKIENTTFEENRANCNTNSKLLAFNDYTENKAEGRGGAIYINPTFAVEGDDEKSMVNVTINNCTFKRNIAFDGFAIYIEGENGANTVYKFTNNFFISNYNGYDSSNGGIIVSEITTITEDQIINNNVFSNEDYGSNASSLIYVDHSGLPLPESTMTPLPTKLDGSYSEIWKQEENIDKRVDVEKNPSDVNEQNVVLKVEATKFENMTELNGSAIHLVNCGLECKNNCEFINLGQEGSVGGAIYIHNPNDFKNSVSLEKLFFKSCTADYGGAIYIYSSSMTNDVSIKGCTFQENKVSLNKDHSDEMSGGSAIFLMAKRGIINLCKFISNTGPGGSIKLVGNFQSDSSTASFLYHENIPKIEMKDCFFSGSESAIFYLAFSEFSSQVEVSDCVFSGKLAKDNHYLEGLIVNKNAPKMFVRSCKFVDKDFEKVIAKNAIFATVDQNSIVLGYSEMENKKEDSQYLCILAVGLAAVALVALVALLLVKKFSNSIENDEQLRDDELVISEATI